DDGRSLRPQFPIKSVGIMEIDMRRKTTALAATAGLALLLPALTACVSTSGDSAGKVQLSLVAYSTPQPAYEKIIAAFQATPAGKNVTFTQSYGASGDQSRAVESGLRADIVEFSLETDMTRLVKDGIVDATWNQNQYEGLLTRSVVVIATRKGNPKGL